MVRRTFLCQVWVILAASVFEKSCGKTDRQSNRGKNTTPRLPSAWVIKKPTTEAKHNLGESSHDSFFINQK